MSVSRHSLAVVTLLSLCAPACGVLSPTGPSGSGTTIIGTATGSGLTASNHPSNPFVAGLLAAIDTLTLATPVTAASGVTVTVVGTGMTVELSGSGKFVLTDVPAGTIQLHFSGPGIDAVLTIESVTTEHIQLVVKLEGTSAKLESFNRIGAGNRAQLEGPISSINHGDRSLRVANVEVKVHDVPVRHGSTIVPFNQLAIGHRVHVVGTMENNHVVAQEVKLQNTNAVPTLNPVPAPDSDDDPRVEVEGSLSALGGACPGVTFIVDGRTVRADSGTSFKHGPCEHLESGTWVEVESTRQGDGTLRAEKVEMKEIEFTGSIASGSACAPGQLVVSGKTVKTDASTSFEKLPCGGFVAGVTVEVKGTEHPNGVIKAIRLKYEGE